MPTVTPSFARPPRPVRGLTFVELIILVGLFTVVAAALFSASLIGNRSHVVAESYVYVNQEARRALDAMASELQSAGGIVTPAGSQLTFQVALGFNQRVDGLLLAACPVNAICWGARDALGAPQAGPGWLVWSVRYRLNGSQLVREILNGAVVQPGTRVLANDVAALTFTYFPAPRRTVAIQLQVRRTNAALPGSGQIQTDPLVMHVKLRNT